VKAKPLLILLATGAVLATSAFYFAGPSQPQYKGLPLSTWLSQYAAPSPNPQRKEAELAIQNMGTNAIPLLLQWIDYQPPQWRTKVARSFPRIQKIAPWLFSPTPRQTRALNATFGFAALGTNAAAAVPTLANLMSKTNRPSSHRNAVYALCAIGTPALPNLAAALRNKDPEVTFLYQWATNTPSIYTVLSIRIHPEQYMELFIIGTNTVARLAANPSTNAFPAQGVQ
jgi:hypothetical protein